MAASNPMVPAPVCYNKTVEKAPYADLAMKKYLPDLKRSMQLGQLNTATLRVVFDNGVIVTVNVCFNREVVDVYVPPVANKSTTVIEDATYTFLFRPRDATNANYSMYSNSVAALSYRKANDAWKTIPKLSFLPNYASVLQYGNVDWKSLPDKNGNVKVLSFMGPPGRLLPFDYLTPIDGLTVSDISFDETDYFTVFRSNIYKKGSATFTVPTTGDVEPKVLGAAYQSDVLVCIVNNHYADKVGFYEECWTNKGDAELFDAELHPNGWNKISSVVSTRPVACWFFNGSGTKATRGVEEYTIDVATGSASKAVVDSPASTQMLLKYTAGFATYETQHSGSAIVYSDYKGDTRVTQTLSITGGTVVTDSAVDTTTTQDAPVYWPGDGLGYFVISFTGISHNQAVATFIGTGCNDCADATWSISSGTITPEGLVDTNTGCGTATVTYTCNGLTATAQIRMASGHWELGELTSYGDGAFGTGAYYERINGGTRYVEYAFGGCGVNLNATQDYTTLATYKSCVGGNCAYPGVVKTTRYCNTSHGYPTPTLPDMTATCDAAHLCANNCQTPYDQVLWDEPTPNCWYLTHSRTDQWVC